MVGTRTVRARIRRIPGHTPTIFHDFSNCAAFGGRLLLPGVGYAESGIGVGSNELESSGNCQWDASNVGY